MTKAKYPTTEGYRIVNDYAIPESVKAISTDAFIKAFGGHIVPGKTADEVLALMPKVLQEKKPVVVGYDYDGAIVEWYYPGVIITFAYAQFSYDAAYTVQQIQVKNDNNR